MRMDIYVNKPEKTVLTDRAVSEFTENPYTDTDRSTRKRKKKHGISGNRIHTFHGKNNSFFQALHPGTGRIRGPPHTVKGPGRRRVFLSIINNTAGKTYFIYNSIVVG